jgi:DNA replication protein DnaC
VQSLIRSTYGRWSQSEEDLFRQWTEVDLLLFDDVGKGVSDERNAETTFRILRTRMDNEKATVITSQYTTAELADALRGRDETLDAIRSRLRGWCEGVVLDGPDRRLERSGPAQGPQS